MNILPVSIWDDFVTEHDNHKTSEDIGIVILKVYSSLVGREQVLIGS